jgi:hypothetical protein
MDVHNNIQATVEAVADAHKKDLEIQGNHGVRYLRYWFDSGAGKIFCLADAPTKEAAERVHSESHGLVAEEIYEVTEGS